MKRKGNAFAHCSRSRLKQKCVKLEKQKSSHLFTENKFFLLNFFEFELDFIFESTLFKCGNKKNENGEKATNRTKKSNKKKSRFYCFAIYMHGTVSLYLKIISELNFINFKSKTSQIVCIEIGVYRGHQINQLRTRKHSLVKFAALCHTRFILRLILSCFMHIRVNLNAKGLRWKFSCSSRLNSLMNFNVRLYYVKKQCELRSFCN